MIVKGFITTLILFVYLKHRMVLPVLFRTEAAAGVEPESPDELPKEEIPPRQAQIVEQRVVYSIYYKGTLVLPGRGERGVALAGCVWVRVE